jgi:hypothetical protein
MGPGRPADAGKRPGGNLIRIAAPDTPSNAAKEERDAMSSTASRATAASCQLVASGSYREQLTIVPLAERSGSFDFRVTAWLDNGGQALAHHTRFRTTLDRDAIARLHQVLGTLLEESLQTA